MPPDPIIMHKPGQSLSLDVGGHVYSTTFGYYVQSRPHA